MARDGGVVGRKRDGEGDGKRSGAAGRISFVVDIVHGKQHEGSLRGHTSGTALRGTYIIVWELHLTVGTIRQCWILGEGQGRLRDAGQDRANGMSEAEVAEDGLRLLSFH